MTDDIALVRRAIEALAPKPQLRRYAPEMRARIVALARAHPERTPWSLASELGMTPDVLYRMLRDAESSPSFKAVRVVDDRRAPVRAIILDGVDVDDLARLIRSLS